MCARTAIKALKGIARDRVKRGLPANFTANYNISPRGTLIILRREDGELAAATRRWGLIPPWAPDLAYGDGKHNARAETVAKLPTFRTAFKKSRCLVAVDGWYEWQKQKDGSKSIPYFIHNPDPDEMIVFAGLEERWNGPEGEVRTCTIITTAPDEAFAKLHDRMPVLLPPDSWDRWLDPAATPEALLGMLVAAPASAYAFHRVGFEVGSSRAKGPQLLEPVAA